MRAAMPGELLPAEIRLVTVIRMGLALSVSAAAFHRRWAARHAGEVRQPSPFAQMHRTRGDPVVRGERVNGGFGRVGQQRSPQPEMAPLHLVQCEAEMVARQCGLAFEDIDQSMMHWLTSN